MIKLMGLIDLQPLKEEEICEDCDQNYDTPTQLNTEDDSPESPEGMEKKEGASAKQQLADIIKKAYHCYKTISDDMPLESWVLQKIDHAAKCLDSVHIHMQHDGTKVEPTSTTESIPPTQSNE